MTNRDIMPFGKFKGLTLDKVDKGYIKWFLEQDWTEEKFPELYEFWSGGSKPTSTTEVVMNEDENRILMSMPKEFSEWWLGAYGRLRTANADLYIPYLRVAREAWQAAVRPRNLPPTPVQPEAKPTSTYTPPPFPKKPASSPSEVLDEDVPF